jgi:hypothetical protein
MAQCINYRHATLWLDLQEPENEVESDWRAQVDLLLEEGCKVPLLEQEPICILLCWVGTHKERLCRKQVECAPTQAPRINLSRYV